MMTNGADRLQGFFGSPQRRLRVARGESVEIRLDTGDVLEGTIDSVRRPTADRNRLSARSRTWSRWTGTSDDLCDFVKKATAEIARRSSEAPTVDVRVALGRHDEERYFDVATFEHEIRSAEAGAPGTRLREIQAIEMTLGSTTRGAMKASAYFGRAPTAAGVRLAVEGEDRTLVAGLTDDLARLIDTRRPRVPALPQPAEMFVGGLAGAAYFVGLASVDWDFMPNGWLGDVLFLILYIAGFIAVIYALTAGMRLVLPPLTLVPPGASTRSAQRVRRALQVAGAVLLAAFPFALEQFFG